MDQTSVTYDVQPPNSSSYETLPPAVTEDEQPPYEVVPPQLTVDEQLSDPCSTYELLPPDHDVQISSSYKLQPPDMSEIRVVLLGNSQSERTAAANFILEVPALSAHGEPDLQPVRGLLKDKEIVLINTPDLLHPNISEHTLAVHVERCVRRCAPGPHVFLLVLQPEDFTEEHRLRLCRVLKLFGDQPFDHSLILISTPKNKKPDFMEKFRLHPPLKHMIKLCRYRYLWRKHLEHLELFTRLVQMLKEKNGEHVTCKAHQ